MVTPLIKPATLLQPFANDPAARNTIPNTPDSVPGHASLDIGFPPLTRTAIELGGVPPSGLDMNGLAYLATSHNAWVAAGGQYTFDAALATFTGGYKLGAVVQSDDGFSSYRSMVANNTDNFNTTPAAIGVTWEAYAGRAVNSSVATVAVMSGNINLTATQAAASIINLNGTLTGAVTVTFPVPVVPRSWRITNNTTGGFAVSAKMPTGASLTLTQTKSNTLFYNGAALQYGDWDSGLDSPALRGVPTAPTPPANTNTAQVATAAFVTSAVSNALLNSAPQYVNVAITAGPTGDLWVDTTAAAFTITLPDPPIGGNPLNIRDIAGTWGTNNLTLVPGTKTVMGVAGNFICNVPGETFGIWWSATANTWKVI